MYLFLKFVVLKYLVVDGCKSSKIGRDAKRVPYVLAERSLNK
jgi:hypothetical protein